MRARFLHQRVRRGEGADLEGEVAHHLGAGCQARTPGTLPGGAEADGAAHGPPGPDHRGHRRLGDAVLEGADQAAVMQMRQKMRQDLRVRRLLTQQEDEVVGALHPVWRHRADRHHQVHLAGDAGAERVQRLDMGPVGVDQFNQPSHLSLSTPR